MTETGVNEEITHFCHVCKRKNTRVNVAKVRICYSTVVRGCCVKCVKNCVDDRITERMLKWHGQVMRINNKIVTVNIVN